MEINHITIRKANPEDASSIFTVIQESFKLYCINSGLDFPVDALRETVDDIKKDILTKQVLVAVVDGIIAGTVRYQILADQTAYLTRFGVLPSFHRAGIGQSLMNEVDRQINEAGIKRIFLFTAAKNKKLVQFYNGRGFYVESTNTDRGYLRALMVKDMQASQIPTPKVQIL